jgi:hypothetical protein
MHPESYPRRADALVCAAIFVITTLYCATAPNNLHAFDEGVFLYEAKRILDGALFYRDFFEFVTPGAFYAMAGSFWLFGTSITTARVTAALIHGLIAVLMIVACRALGVRRSIAVVVGVSHAAICYPPIPRAAPHWFATLFSMLLLVMLLRRRLTSSRNALLAGLLVASLFLIQQNKGAAMALVPAAVLLIDHWLLARAPKIDWRSMLTCTAAYGGAVLLLVVSVIGAFILFAGFEPVYAALVRFPMGGYRAYHTSVSWGKYAPGYDPPIAPIIKYLSLLAPVVAAARAVWQWHIAASPAARRPLLVALVTSIGALFSVAYLPGYPYLVLVAPVWFTLVADALQAGLEHAEQRWPKASIVSLAVVGSLAVALTFGLIEVRRALRAQWRYSTDTAFGQISFATEGDLGLFTAARDEIRSASTRDVFVYPSLPGFYLLTDTTNPTRFQVLIPRYSEPEHVQEVLDVLETRRVPFIVRNLFPMDHAADRLLPYILKHYKRVRLPYPPGVPTLALFKRRVVPRVSDHNGDGVVTVYCLGDTHTARRQLRTPPPTWCEMLAAELPTWTFINGGVASATAAGDCETCGRSLLAAALAAHPIDLVLIALGTNDMHDAPEAVVDTLLALREQAAQKDVEALIATMPPEFTLNLARVRRIKTTNDLLSRRAPPDCLIDFFSGLELSDYVPGGTEVARSGHRKLAAAALRALQHL